MRLHRRRLSLPLAVSNLTNIIAADYFYLEFGRFAAWMALPSLLTLAVSWAMLVALYRREIPGRYDAALAPAPATAIRDPLLFRVGTGVLAVMMAMLTVGARTGIPVSAVMASGAALLLVATRVNRVVPAGRVLRQAPWHVVVFAMGMYLIVFGLGKAGLGNWLAGVVAAFDAPAVAPAAREAAAMAAVVGSDIGPKLTPVGSLATLIWMHVLEVRGLHVTWLEYMRVGLIVTPVVLAAALLGLWVMAQVM